MPYMKWLIPLFFLLPACTGAFAQQGRRYAYAFDPPCEVLQPMASYRHYRILFDTCQKKNILLDTATAKRTEINIPYTNYPHSVRFERGFVYARTGDMKALMSLSGKLLLGPSHYINFYDADSLMEAYVCNGAAWIFLNYRGDTLSWGYGYHHYHPPRPGLVINDDKRKGKIYYGFIDAQARWKILPVIEKAGTVREGKTPVMINGLWGLIDAEGNFLKKAEYKEEESVWE